MALAHRLRPRSTDPADYQRVPRPVAAMAKDFAAGHHILPHSHERAQLIFAAHGAMLIATREGSWAVPPQRALWMPGGVTHEIRMAGDVAMRMLYVAETPPPGWPTVRVLAVSPLLRELILRACALPLFYDEAGPAGRLMTLIVDEIAALPTVALELPLPRDARLGRICRALSAEPGDTRTLADWGREAGASPRTLARLFVKETGLTFAAWRQQARLLAATAMLGAGEPITRIALDLGYESPSAFTAMFKRTLGAPRAITSAAGSGCSVSLRAVPIPPLHAAQESPPRRCRGRNEEIEGEIHRPPGSVLGLHRRVHDAPRCLPPQIQTCQRFFRVTPPAVHRMVLALEQRGLLKRVAGKARSIRLLLPPVEIPKLARHERSGACDRSLA